MKKISYQFNKVQHDSRSVASQSANKMVQVDPGFSAETVLTFKGEGNQLPKQESANLVIKFKEIEHASYKRAGKNLIYTHKISFEDALNM